MNPAGSLEGFQQDVRYRYRNIPQTIVGILLAYPTDDVALPILNHIDYFHVRSGDLFDFYLPGYLNTETWCPHYYSPAFTIEGCKVNFCIKWYVEFIDYFNKNIPRYYFSGDPELMLFNVNHGCIDYSRKILFNLKELQSNGHMDFNTLFEKIHKCIEDTKYKSTDQLTAELGTDIISDSILDTLKGLITKRISFLKNYEKNRRGIYFN